MLHFLAIGLLAVTLSQSAGAVEPPRTTAEATDYAQTSTYADVVSFIDALAGHCELVTPAEFGRTHEDRAIPMMILADPAIATAEEAMQSGKLRIFAFANIHAGEVCGKEALLQLARDIALSSDHPEMLQDIVLCIVPIYNADGNERFDDVANNRPGQVGPERVGVRHNAQDRDLNRDYVKLEAPETRALVRFLNQWDPHITIDCHTTNGSVHRYTLTYSAPLNPSGPSEPIEFIRDLLLPKVGERLLERTGYDSFFYGNFNRDHTAWATYSAQPRFGCPYRGLRGQMSILSEAYSYAPFKDRVIATLEFVREILKYAAQQDDEIKAIHDRARASVVAAGQDPQPADVIGLRHQLAAGPGLVMLKGFAYESEPGRGVRPRPTEEHRDYPVVHLDRFVPTLSVARPHAYIIEPGHDNVIEKLRQHGIVVQPFEGEAEFEVYTIEAVQTARSRFEGHRIRSLEVRARQETLQAEQGSHMVSLAQPLGTLAAYLLEPQSEDGLAAWEFFNDEAIAEGARYPAWRVNRRDDLP
ncbi:MAG: M14 family metallopeptidase [Phycisphaerales bacterium]